MSKPVVIALDPARKLGCAVGPAGGVPVLSSIVLGGKDDAPLHEVFGHAVEHLDRLIARHSPSLIAIEEPFFREGKTTYDVTKTLHGLYGGLVGIARARRVMVASVTVRTWRATALGTAKFSNRMSAKDAMMRHCSRLGWLAEDDNAADAAGIHIWASATHVPYGQLLTSLQPGMMMVDDVEGYLLSAGGRR